MHRIIKFFPLCPPPPKKKRPMKKPFNIFLQVFCKNFNGNTYGTKYLLPRDKSCWASKSDKMFK